MSIFPVTKNQQEEKHGSQRTIFISAYRNVSVRYILYSDIFKKLREQKDLRIVVFLKANDIEYYRRKLGGDNILFESVLFDKAYSLLRSNILSVFFVLVRRCLSGKRKGYDNATDKVLRYRYKEDLSGSLKWRIYYLAVRMVAAIGSRTSFIRKFILASETILFPGRMYDGYFKKYRPDMLVISSIGNMIDSYFMRAAKRNRCKVVSIVHSWDNTSTRNYRGADPDVVIAWNDIMKREVNIFHDVPKENIWVGGIAHWDFYFDDSFKPRSKKEFLRFCGLSEGKQIIFYGTSSPKAFRNTFDVIEQLLREMEIDPILSETQLLVRLHPSYLNRLKGNEGLVLDRYKGRMDELERMHGDRIAFNLPKVVVLNDDLDMTLEDMYILAEILTYSDVMLTEYSTLMIEGSIFDLPVINIGLYNFIDTAKPASYFEEMTHIKRIIETGATKNAYKIEQVCEYIKWYLEDPCRDRELRKKVVDREVDTNPGHAGEKIAKYIYELLYERIKVNS